MQNAIEYRADFFLSLFSAIFPMIIQYFLWTNIFRHVEGDLVYGYTYSQMLTYTILAGVITKVLATGFEWEISRDIKDGSLDRFIIKPIKYAYYRVCAFIGKKVIQMVVLFLIAGLVLVGLHYWLDMTVTFNRMMVFIPTIILSLFINFLMFYSISTLAFWVTEVSGLFIITGLLINIASGGVIPLDLFGDTALKILKFLPFKYTIYYPINVINGRLGTDAIWEGMMIQVMWIILLIGLSKVLWRMGQEKYISAGG